MPILVTVLERVWKGDWENMEKSKHCLTCFICSFCIVLGGWERVSFQIKGSRPPLPVQRVKGTDPEFSF